MDFLLDMDFVIIFQALFIPFVCVFFCMDFFSFVILLLLSYLASKYFLFF